jgi:hypothetical protein
MSGIFFSQDSFSSLIRNSKVRGGFMAALSPISRFADALAAQAQLNAHQQVWLDEKCRLVGGEYPNPAWRYDFAAEAAVAVEAVAPQKPARTSLLGSAKRITELHEFEVLGATFLVGSQKQLLVEALRRIEEARPGTLDQLSKKKRRTKRVVSRSREALYDTPHKPSHSQEIPGGFFVATNNSYPEAMSFLREAVRIAGLTWGIDVMVRKPA